MAERVPIRYGNLPLATGSFDINDLADSMVRHRSCFIKGMNIWVVLVAIQIVISLVAFFRESGEDTRFEGDKLALRS